MESGKPDSLIRRCLIISCLNSSESELFLNIFGTVIDSIDLYLYLFRTNSEYMADYASIKIKIKTKNSADRLIKKYEMNGLEFYEAMVEYFVLMGINPKDRQVLSPAEELKKFRDTIISFMRKQEKDYILPVFGQMEVLIARFMLYIENEAPKRGGEGMFSAPSFEEKKEEKPALNVSEMKISVPNMDTSKLEMELETERQKVKNLKSEMMKIFNNSDLKSTGLQKKIVVDMSQNDFDNIKQMVKLL